MAQSRVLILQHADWERPGRILDQFDEVEMKYDIDNVVDEKKPKFPKFNSLAGVVLMGGPMGALDITAHPGIKAESKLVRACVGSGKPVLGVCLGHQILATALGAKLKTGKSPEIGYGDIHRVDKHDYFSMFSATQKVLNWHTDSVSLPEGGQLLASSEQTKNQAFRMGSALGLQFHIEVTASLLNEWLGMEPLVKGMKKSHIAQIKADFEEYDSQIQVFADAVFSGFAARCVTHAREIGEALPQALASA